MIADPKNAQAPAESRTEKVCIAATPSEKDAIEIVVKVRRPEGGASGILRERPWTEVVAEGRRMLDRLAETEEGPE